MDFFNNDSALFFSLLSLGFFGGFSHCSAMCGPLVMTQVNNKLQQTKLDDFVGLSRLSKLALFPYHFGRITTYSLIGLGCFLVRKNLDDFLEFRLISATLLLVGALFFMSIFLAQNREFFRKIFAKLMHSRFFKCSLYFQKILLRFKRTIFLKLSSISAVFLKKNFNEKIGKLLKKNDAISRYFLGIILGFLPCGMLYGAFAISGNFSSPFLAFFGMMIFGFATFPALFAVAVFGKLIFKLPEFKIISNLVNLANIFLLLKMSLSLIS